MRFIFNHHNIDCDQITDFRPTYIDIVDRDSKHHRFEQPDGTTLQDIIKKVNAHGNFFIFRDIGFNAEHIQTSHFNSENSTIRITLTSCNNRESNVYTMKNRTEEDHIEFVRLQNVGLRGGFNLDGSERQPQSQRHQQKYTS